MNALLPGFNGIKSFQNFMPKETVGNQEQSQVLKFNKNMVLEIVESPVNSPINNSIILNTDQKQNLLFDNFQEEQDEINNTISKQNVTPIVTQRQPDIIEAKREVTRPSFKPVHPLALMNRQKQTNRIQYGGYGNRKVILKKKSHQKRFSLRSSFDYVDLNMNEAMNAAGTPALTGRGKHFFKKPYQEDNWSDDDSVFARHIKMPDINTDQIDYEKEIGLNLNAYEEAKPIDYQTERGLLTEAQEMLPPTPFYKIVKKDRIQIIDDYTDRCPFLNFRKYLMRARVYINRGAQKIHQHFLFENSSIIVIIINSIFLAMDDPLRDPALTPSYLVVGDQFFLYFYTSEMIVKVVSLGFIMNQMAYLRDPWNILDFTIIFSGYIGILLQGSGVNLSVLRSFRVIRPLRTISTIQGLRVIVSSLINALPLLRDSLLVLIFSFMIFSIVGTQLFMGSLKNQCYNVDTGLIWSKSSTSNCGGGTDCPNGYFCGKSNFNPGDNSVLFDNVFYAFQQVFQVVTLNGYTQTLITVQQAAGTWTCAYFYIIVFICAFFLLNLTLAVIKAKFTEEMENKKEMAKPKKKRLHDAALSSEDEDIKMYELLSQLKEIKQSKQMSPRSKENKLNKIRIEHLLWKVDNTMDKRDVEHKIVEKTVQEDQQMTQSKPANKSYDRSVFSEERENAFAKTEEKLVKAGKMRKSIKYSNIFYSRKGSALLYQNVKESPRNNLSNMIKDVKPNSNQVIQRRKKRFLARSPIKEGDIDEDDDDRGGIVPKLIINNLMLSENFTYSQREKIFLEQRRIEDQERESRHKISINLPLNMERKNYMRHLDPSKVTEASQQASWLDQGFEVRMRNFNRPKTAMNQGEKRLVFAGINSMTNRGSNRTNLRSRFGPKRSMQLNDENVKRSVFESIAKLDVVDNVDNKNGSKSNQDQNEHSVLNNADQFSEDVYIKEESDNPSDSGRYYDAEIKPERDHEEPMHTQILDLDDENNDEEISFGNGQNIRGAVLNTYINRSSTQATATDKTRKDIVKHLNQDLQDNSPFKIHIMKQVSLTPREIVKKTCGIISAVEPLTEEPGIFKQLMCKSGKTKKKGGYQEQYQMIKEKKRRSSAAKRMSRQLSFGTVIDQQQETTKSCLRQTVKSRFLQKQREQELEESSKFMRRIEVMNQRRAQYFAPTFKIIDSEKDDLMKEYEDYVFRKRKIKIDASLIDEDYMHKRILYRSASTEAIIRRNERMAFEALMPLGAHNKVLTMLDQENFSENSSDSSNVGSNKSQLQERDYQKIIDKYTMNEEEINRRKKQESVPDMQRILQDKELKLVIKMNNHQYTSVNDIFQDSNRFITEQRRKQIEIEDKQRLKFKFAKKAQPRQFIIGYQKKVFIREKELHEELLRNEFQESDEDQDGMLIRIEDEYNQDHRSHIYVNGTISVVVNKPPSDNKLMNVNYHANIKASNLQREQQQELQTLFQQIDAIHQTNDAKINNIKVVIQDEQDQPQTTSVKYSFFKRPTIWDKNEDVDHLTKSLGKSSFGRGHSQKLLMSMRMKKEEENEDQGSRHKPELLTDRQILRCLNDEFTQSRIFKALKINQLPNKIFRDEEVDKNLFNKKKNKNNAENENDEEENEPEAELENANKKRKFDYYLDSEFTGKDHIEKAIDLAFKRHKDEIEWSGQDVLSRVDPFKSRKAVASLNQIRVWPYGLHGLIKKIRVPLKFFMRSTFVEHFMTSCVIGNTIVLSLDYYGASKELEDFNTMANTFFTITFACELILKLSAIGPKKWSNDKMNFMDAAIVILSLVELIFMSGGGALTALRSVRIFRIFRVLRVARLLRSLKSMVQIIAVITRSFQSLMYLTMLLFLFVFIYALLGMQIFGGQFRDPGVVGTCRYNYDNFNNAFMTSFVILTTENWNNVLTYAYSSIIPSPVIAIYFISDIFIGNWMLLNLLLSILLDSFTAVEEEEMVSKSQMKETKQKMVENLKQLYGEEFIEGMMEIQKEGFAHIHEKVQKKSKKSKKSSKMDKEANAGVTNILDESQEVDLQELARRDMELLEQRKLLFRGIDCNMSCYIFSKQNWIRIACYKTIFHPKFETFIMIIICFSSFKLVFDTYTNDLSNQDPLVLVSTKFDLVFQGFFTLEMVIKIIAFGFAMDDNSYFSEAWNKLDCFIVTTGLLDSTLQNVNIPFIKVLRLLRILRPLRFVSHSSSMKTLIDALLASMSSLLNVSVVILIVFLIFAILGVNLYAGKTQFCTQDFYTASTRQECYQSRGNWLYYNQGMDNVIDAMITLFILANGEDWPDMMYYYTDMPSAQGMGPSLRATIYNAYFFLFFNALANFFFMNLFVGVLFMNFEKAQRNEKEAMLLDGDEVKWVDMMKMICNEKPDIIQVSKNPVSRWCYEITKDGSLFANFIMACIILNIFTMAAIYEGMSADYQLILDYINYAFTGAFTLECILKLIAHSLAYFNTGWNKFDFFVVTASYVDIILNTMSASSLNVIKVGPQVARIMRVMRVSRLFRLLHKYKGLQALMQTITFSLPSVMNAFSLLTLVYFIASVLGVFFFKNIDSGFQLDPVYMNFHNFTQSIRVMLRMSTGDDWQWIMFDCSDTTALCQEGSTCGSAYAPIFFITYILIMQYIMVNLFVLIILQQFDLYYLPNDNVLDRFKSDLNNFKLVWRHYSADYEGFKIRGNDVLKFFKDLKGDLGMAHEKDQKALERNLVMMNIQADEDGNIYFNELLYKTMKRRYANGRTKKKILYEVELQTLERLEVIMKQQIYQSRKKERHKAVAVNPFMALMYKNMSFNVWKDIYAVNEPMRRYEMERGLERQVSEIEEVVVEEEVYEYETDKEEVMEQYDEEYYEMERNRMAEEADPQGSSHILHVSHATE